MPINRKIKGYSGQKRKKKSERVAVGGTEKHTHKEKAISLIKDSKGPQRLEHDDDDDDLPVRAAG